MKRKSLNNNSGFSLVELIVVVAIMAVLVIILAPAMLRYVEKTRLQKDESALSEVANAAELAVGEESIMSAINGTSDIILTITELNITDNAVYVSGTSGSPVSDEVKKTIGNGVKFVSKTYHSSPATAYVKLTYDSGKGTYVFAKTTSGKSFSTASADLSTH